MSRNGSPPSVQLSKKVRRKNRRIAQLRQRDGDDCWLCGKPMLFDYAYINTDLFRSEDHIIRRADGGPIVPLRNLKLAHRICNSKRDEHHVKSLRKPKDDRRG